MESININSSATGFFDTLPELQKDWLISIDENPGIRYRELLRLVNSSNGVLSYHIHKLEKNELLNVDRKSRIMRFFPRYFKWTYGTFGNFEKSNVVWHHETPLWKVSGIPIRNSKSHQEISIYHILVCEKTVSRWYHLHKK